MRRKAIGVGAGAWLDDLPLLLERRPGRSSISHVRSARSTTPLHARSVASARIATNALSLFTATSISGMRSKRGADSSSSTRMNGHDGLQRTLASMPPASGIGGVVERVSTGLLGTNVGLQPVGRQMLAVADRVAGYG